MNITAHQGSTLPSSGARGQLPRPQGASHSSTLLGRKSQLTRPVTRLRDITWDLVVARRREAQLRNQFLKTVLRLAQDDRR